MRTHFYELICIYVIRDRQRHRKRLSACTGGVYPGWHTGETATIHFYTGVERCAAAAVTVHATIAGMLLAIGTLLLGFFGILTTSSQAISPSWVDVRFTAVYAGGSAPLPWAVICLPAMTLLSCGSGCRTQRPQAITNFYLSPR